jgi:hypothetical protein
MLKMKVQIWTQWQMFSSLLGNVKILVWRRTFKGHVWGMISPKLTNMPPMMKKFVGTWNMFLYSPPRQIYENVSLGQKHLANVNTNGTKHTLELIEAKKI